MSGGIVTLTGKRRPPTETTTAPAWVNRFIPLATYAVTANRTDDTIVKDLRLVVEAFPWDILMGQSPGLSGKYTDLGEIEQVDVEGRTITLGGAVGGRAVAVKFQEETNMSTGTVIARGGLNLRKSPKTGSVINSLRRGTKVEVLGEETWLRVRTRDGTFGYVLADYIESEPASVSILPSTVTDAAVEVRPAEVPPTEESDVCDIRPYHRTQFIGKEIRADVDFWPHLDRINQYALDCDVQVFVTSSTREPGRTVRGNIVKPASRSNHLVGHAIDMNLKSRNGFFNSTKLKRSNFNQLPDETREFLDKVRADGDLRWGGDFSKEDPVHIDDGLNVRNPERWDAKLASRK